MKTRAEQEGLRRAAMTIALACCAGLVSACAPPEGEPEGPGAAQQKLASALPSYNVHVADTSVSGLSSGAFFAAQMGVAFSSVLRGVGVVAGGPYDCAGEMAYYSCMYQSSPSVSTSISNTKSWSGSAIDASANMASQKIFMFSGTQDTTVATSVMNQLYSYYVTSGSFVPAGSVSYDKSVSAVHTFPTDFDSTGNNSCSSSASPYISNCGFDAAGAILQQIYGTLNARNNGTLGGSILQFDQSEFLSNPNSHGLDTTGWAYVPAACAQGAQCKLHVAFHGCLQYYGTIGDKFIKNTGYNKWADANDIIVLYPQTVADSTNHNPSPSMAGANNNGCWDWVGYYGADFDRRTGVQMAAVKKMIDRIASGYSGAADGGAPDSGGGGDGGVMVPPAPSGLGVTGTTSSTVSLSWGTSAGAQSYNVFRNGSQVNASGVTSTSYTDTGLSASTSYTYTVTAVDSAGSSGNSNQVSATTAAAATCFTGSNYAHVQAGRAHDNLGYADANGSNQNMGLDNLFYTTTLKQTGANYYVIGTCP